MVPLWRGPMLLLLLLLLLWMMGVGRLLGRQWEAWRLCMLLLRRRRLRLRRRRGRVVPRLLRRSWGRSSVLHIHRCWPVRLP